MREALGPDFTLLVEVHRRLAPMHAIRIGRRIAEYDIGWYEEPCLCDNIELVAEVRRVADIPRKELDAILRAADSWRGSQTERGFSMALGRIGAHGDEECVLVTAKENEVIRAVRPLVPWSI